VYTGEIKKVSLCLLLRMLLLLYEVWHTKDLPFEKLYRQGLFVHLESTK
jgi:hypothetical protein